MIYLKSFSAVLSHFYILSFFHCSIAINTRENLSQQRTVFSGAANRMQAITRIPNLLYIVCVTCLMLLQIL